MRSAKRWLAMALLLLIGSLMLIPFECAAVTGGFVEFYSAYGTSYEEVYPNGFEEAHSDFVYGNTNNALKYTLPKAFRFEVVVCDDNNFNFIAKPNEPIYIEAEMGETTTKHIKFSFDRDGKSNEINLNLSINPANQGSGETPQNSTNYAIFYAYNGQITEGDYSYNVKSHEGSGFIGGIVANVFEKYPYIKFELSSSYSLLLKLVAIVPGNKMTNQVHLKYSGRTEYEQLKEFGIKNNFGGYNGIKSAYYTITYDKASDLMRRYAVITEIRTDNPNFNIVHSVGDEWEFTISSGIQNAPERLFYNDIINIKSKASVLKWSIPEFTFKQRGVESSPLRLRMVLDSARFDLEFINPDRADDFVYKEYLYTGHSYENPQIVTQEVDMTTKLDQILFSDDADPKLTAIYYDSSDVVLKIHRNYSVYYPPFYKPTITVPKAPDGVKPVSGGPSGTNNQSIDTDADDNPGETDVTIPAALAIVIIGGGAAMAGAGTGGKSGDDDDKKKSRYKMCLRKDFGDAIRYDTQPVTVYARIVEITPEGEEIDRPDLSARIEMFSGGGLKVEGTAIADNYMGALVCAESVPGGQNPDSGVLSIRFSGEGGSFQNNVTFRLVGDAAIHFPERGKMLTPTTYMLYGDNGDYQVPIELIDFILPPQKVRLELPGNQPFTAETERIDDTHYIIHLHNTSPIQTDKAQPQQIFMVFVYAENEKESAHDNFLVNLLPEGLSLRPFTGCPIDENGRLQVVCSLAPEQGEAEVEIEKTEFQLVLCVSQIDESGRKQAILVDSNSMDCRFDPMTAESEKLQNLLKAFVYEMEFSEAKRTGIFRICPKRQLPQDDRLDYDIALPVSCDYKDQTYTLDIPIRLLGDKLLPMAEKSEEIALLIKRIRKFVDEEERAALIRGFKNDLPKMSATDVRLLSKSLVYATQAEVYKANMHLLNAEMLDWVCWGLDWYKWIGDQAISVIISKLSYNYAPFVEAIVMPAKDLLVEHMGIWLSNYISGSPSPSAEFDLEQLESTGLTMIENILTNLIDGKTEPKKAAQILSVYLVIRTAHAYFYETNDDGSPIGIYGAIASAFGDLTAQSFKIILGTKLEQLAKNPATTKMFGGYADEFVKGLFPAEFYNNGGEWEFDLIKKYIEEITVLASAKVYSGIQEGAEQDTVVGDIIVTLIENTEDPEKTVRIAVNPLDLGKEFFDYIFDRLFGMFSFADSAVESPKDPPCILA